MRVMKPMDLLQRHIRKDDPIYFRIKGDTWLRLTTCCFDGGTPGVEGSINIDGYCLQLQEGARLFKEEYHSPHLFQLLKLSILDKVRTGNTDMDKGLDIQQIVALADLP